MSVWHNQVWFYALSYHTITLRLCIWWWVRNYYLPKVIVISCAQVFKTNKICHTEFYNELVRVRQVYRYKWINKFKTWENAKKKITKVNKLLIYVLKSEFSAFIVFFTILIPLISFESEYLVHFFSRSY